VSTLSTSKDEFLLGNIDNLNDTAANQRLAGELAHHAFFAIMTAV
jgi:hypothetical protein